MSELGARLKQARKEKGYSLDDLQELTKIQKRYLSAIEEGDFGIMPGTFYVRAFIKQYAEAVGLDPDEMLALYKAEAPAPAPGQEPGMPAPAMRRSTMARRSGRAAEVMPKVILALFIVLAVAIVWFLSQMTASNSKDEERQEPDRSVKVEQPGGQTASGQQSAADEESEAVDADSDEEAADETAGAEEEKSAAALSFDRSEGETSYYSLAGADTATVMVKGSGRSWVTATDSAGAQHLSRTVESGQEETIEVSGVDWIRLRIGYTPGVSLIVNGQKLEYEIPETERVTQNIVIQLANKQ
ncbi:RodZ family helix-turn-helix domain-containing protein [Bhargavaea ullalensis]|uniref:Cytoskeletal protein RodZ n=1 Tax=Bhargavaea ullalensis TaxID=1265685 RepID=A0ABV2GER1_9BACL